MPGYLRCGTICGETPTSGEIQQQNLDDDLARQTDLEQQRIDAELARLGITYEEWVARQREISEDTPGLNPDCPYVDAAGGCHLTED